VVSLACNSRITPFEIQEINWIYHSTFLLLSSWYPHHCFPTFNCKSKCFETSC
jgi:hypothetical protein